MVVKGYYWLLLISSGGTVAFAFANNQLQQQATNLKNYVNTLKFVESIGDLLCSYNLKTVYVYFDNETLRGETPRLLKRISNCDTAYVTLSNRTAPFMQEQHKSILMYLVVIVNDSTQQLQHSIVMKKSSAKYLKHIFLIIEKAGIDEEWLRQTFVKFWYDWVYNVVIMYWRDQTLHIFRYDPFGKNGMSIIVRRVFWQRKMPPPVWKLFPRQLPDMQKFPILMCAYEEQTRAIFKTSENVIGSDGLMSQYIADGLNATRVINRIERFKLNHSYDICYDEMANDIDNFSINLRLMSPAALPRQKLEFTTEIRRDDLSVLVPKAQIASSFSNLTRAFDPHVWLLVLTVLFLSCIFCLLIYRRACFNEDLVLQFYAGMLGMALTRLPRQISMRLFVLSWLFYGLLISSAFKGNLMTNLVFYNYQPDINTISDLASSPHELVVCERQYKYVEKIFDKTENMRRIKQKTRCVSDAEMVELIISNNLSNAYMMKYHSVAFQANSRNHWSQGRPLFHVMGSSLVPFHGVYAVPYGSPYLGYFNMLVRTAQEFGFSVYWENLMLSNFIKSGKYIVRSSGTNSEISDNLEVLTLHHFQSAFYLLFGGLLLSTVVFVLELTSKYFKRLVLAARRH